MSERDSVGLPQERERPSSTKSSSSSSCCLYIVLDSIKIVLRNKQIFFPIFALLALPLSLHLFSLSFVSLPLKSHIHHLESVAFYSATRFEARHIWKESRESAISLLRLKAPFFLPSFILSLLAAISSVTSTAAGIKNQRPNLHSALTAIGLAWHRPVVTTICIYAFSLLYFNVPRALAVVIGGGSHLLRFLIWVVLLGLDVHLMAVMGMGLVVSITEERFGWEAIRVGSGLMGGRRLCGWMLSGLMVLISGVIGWKMERLLIMAIDRQEPSNWWMAAMVVVGGWDRFGLVCLYGFVVVWSYVIATVYYSDCRKRHVRVEENGAELIPV